MHSSIGTGSLAYVVGSKIMDVRTYSRDNGRREAEGEGRQASEDNTNKLNDYCDTNNSCTDTMDTCQRESDSDSSDIASVIESIDSAAGDLSGIVPSLAECDYDALESRRQEIESEYPVHNFFDFPALPVTNLFEKSDGCDQGSQLLGDGCSSQWKLGFGDERKRSFRFGDNEEIIVERDGSPSESIRPSTSSEVEIVDGHFHEPQKQVSQPDTMEYKNKVLNRLRISDIPETVELYSSNGQGGAPKEDKVSEWLWTLHRIGN